MTWMSSGVARGDAYDRRFRDLAASGVDVHGEASFVERYGQATVLDAGCGTGRVSIELDRRGFDVVGVDLDPVMLETARRLCPGIAWHHGDIATIRLGATFDRIVAAGNVMIFVDPESVGLALRNLARHLNPGGLLIAGFQLLGGGLDLDRYDQLASDAGLTLVERFATWDREHFVAGGGYAVSIHAFGDDRSAHRA